MKPPNSCPTWQTYMHRVCLVIGELVHVTLQDGLLQPQELQALLLREVENMAKFQMHGCKKGTAQ